jgi:pimeloyl-ACP methyl ester carboxylesterase
MVGRAALSGHWFRYFTSELEHNFVVVYWDQRGAGRSFDPKADPHRLTIPRHIADLDAVVDHLRQGLDRDQIILIGHSWGTTLGLLYTQAHRQDAAMSNACQGAAARKHPFETEARISERAQTSCNRFSSDSAGSRGKGWDAARREKCLFEKD